VTGGALSNALSIIQELYAYEDRKSRSEEERTRRKKISIHADLPLFIAS
jgi:hypothetical protein